MPTRMRFDTYGGGIYCGGGAPRIQSELALLGHRIGETTVGKYMVRGRRGNRQTWQTFLRNHMSVAAACDFFTVPTLTFKMLYVFVVLSHNRRRILHVNVTRHPTRAWTAQQLFEAFPDGEEPQFLHRDGDGIYGPEFRRRAKAFGIDEVVSARESPWQNPFVERVIGSIRRECVFPPILTTGVSPGEPDNNRGSPPRRNG